jgi:hypothetical protein
LPKLFRRCVSVEASAAQAGHAAQNVIGSDEGSSCAAAFAGSAIGLAALLKSVQHVDAIEIDLGRGPRAFSVGGASGAVFATSSNNLNATSMALSGVYGSVVLSSISKPHPAFLA